MKISTKNILKIASAGVGAIALSLAFVGYINGSLDIPFLPRPSLHGYIKEEEPAVPSNPQPIPDDEAVLPKSGVEEFINSLTETAALKAEGYSISDKRYSPDGCVLGILNKNGEKAPYSRSEGTRVLTSITGKEEITLTEQIPTFWPRMGYIFRTNEDKTLSLLDGMGNIIEENLSDRLSFVGERDREDHPVFYNSETEKYVYFNGTEWVDSSYNPATDIRGIHYDYPSYYGKPDSQIHRIQSGTLFGYGTESAGSGPSFIVQPVYTYGYEFRENFCTALDSKNRLFVFNNAGTNKYYEYNIYRPENDEIEYLGYYYFDHGIMRARIIDKATNIDYEAYLTTNESKFVIPSGYTVKSYSDGVFLLEKNGLYGYMNYGGKWICNPVLTDAKPFIEGVAAVKTSGGKWGAIDINGNQIIPTAFDNITNMSGGVIALYSGENCYIMNKLAK